MRRFVLHLAAAACLVLAPMFASAAEYGEGPDDTPSGGAMAFDLLIVRPVSLVATVVGTVLFVVSLPLTVIQGNVEDPAEKLVGDPARYTFTRPLGQMD